MNHISNELTICIPAFNESMAIEAVLIELKKEFPLAEIIVVDDGSVDDTNIVVKRIKGIKLLTHHRNIGYGGALKTALRSSCRPYIAWYDADGQHTTEDLRKVVAPILCGESDVVIGSRGKALSHILGRDLGKKILKIVAEAVAIQKIPDLNSGLRCFRTEVIKRYLHLLPDGFSASSTSTLLMIMRGYRLSYVSIKTKPRIGKSSVKFFRDGFNALQLVLRILILFRALPFFSVLAFVQISIGSLYGWIIYLRNHMGIPILSAIIIISGILTFFMGLICDQIVCLRKERFEDFDCSNVYSKTQGETLYVSEENKISNTSTKEQILNNVS